MKRITAASILYGSIMGPLLLGGPGCTGDGETVPAASPGYHSHPVNIVEQVRARLPRLNKGMTEEQVAQVLKDLPLGQGTIASMTISGGKTVQYELSPGHHLELTYLPDSHVRSPAGTLYEAALTD